MVLFLSKNSAIIQNWINYKMKIYIRSFIKKVSLYYKIIGFES
jgi:hypothetical protein